MELKGFKRIAEMVAFDEQRLEIIVCLMRF